ncbi:MAG TPA: hypothetical protein VMJ70_04740 [Candidatus Sulfotelmatobacter sp.]|nr:hypothetical protein [Candidatus Sulfotelmatobacter sp.]
MRQPRAAALAVLMVWGAGSGCTALKEIPPKDYVGHGDLKSVRLITRDSLEYEFDYAKVQGDSITGYRRRDDSGPAPEYASLALPLQDVQKLSMRQTDWTRTMLIGGLGVLLVATAGLAAKNSNSIGGGNDSSGGSGRLP